MQVILFTKVVQEEVTQEVLAKEIAAISIYNNYNYDSKRKI